MSVYRSGRGIVAEIRGYRQPKKKPRRVPKRLWGHLPETRQLDAAKGWAAEADRYIDLLESGLARPGDIRRAAEISAITEAEAAALIDGDEPVDEDGMPQSSLSKRTSLEDFAEHVDSIVKERDRSPREYQRHMRCLKEYQEHSGVRRICDITRDSIVAFVKHMRRKKLQYETRRHGILYLRYICRSLPSIDLPNPLAGQQVDENDDPESPLDVLTLDELCQVACAIADDRRALAALGLGAFVGMGAAEIRRIRIGDWPDRIIRIGHRGKDDRKNQYRKREAPLPRVVAFWLDRCAEGRKDGAHLIARGKRLPPQPRIHYPAGDKRTERPWEEGEVKRLCDLTRMGFAESDVARALRRSSRSVRGKLHALRASGMDIKRGPRPLTDQPLTSDYYSHWMGRVLSEAAGRHFEPNNLRHSFSTWCASYREDGKLAFIQEDVEHYMGHTRQRIGKTRGRVYTAAFRNEELRPFAAKIDQILYARLPENLLPTRPLHVQSV